MQQYFNETQKHIVMDFKLVGLTGRTKNTHVTAGSVSEYSDLLLMHAFTG